MLVVNLRIANLTHITFQFFVHLIQQLLFCRQVKLILTGNDLFLVFGKGKFHNRIVFTRTE